MAGSRRELSLHLFLLGVAAYGQVYRRVVLSGGRRQGMRDFNVVLGGDFYLLQAAAAIHIALILLYATCGRPIARGKSSCSGIASWRIYSLF